MNYRMKFVFATLCMYVGSVTAQTPSVAMAVDAKDGLNVDFIGAGYCPNTGSTALFWYFGDQGYSGEPQAFGYEVSHTYSSSGTYDVVGVVSCYNPRQIRYSDPMPVTVVGEPSGNIWLPNGPCSLESGETKCTTSVQWSSNNANSATIWTGGGNAWTCCQVSGQKDWNFTNASGSTLILRAGTVQSPGPILDQITFSAQ